MKKEKGKRQRARKIGRREFVVASGLAGAAIVAAGPGKVLGLDSARISIDYSRPLHLIPKTIYGHFIEELGKCIMGGIWRPVKGADQFLSGVPWDLMEAVKKIRPAIIRYPGGCYADSYHWQGGIGPREKRPVTPNKAWGMFGKAVGPDDTNQFGTDEFILFCREVGAEPMLTANVGSGTVEEAAAWVEYCNGGAGTKWGAERAKNGHREPFGVKYWCVGNEMWNLIDGGFTAEAYAKKYLEFAQAMRAVDPNLKLILSGWTDSNNNWNRKALEIAGKETDYLSIHSYGPSKITEMDGKWKQKFGYQSTFKVLDKFENKLNLGISAIKEVGIQDRDIKVSFDEWNLWYLFLEVVQTNYNLRDGLFVAAMLSRLQRLADKVPIANIAQMVNCIGIIVSDERGTFLTPSAWAFNIYTQYALDRYLAPTMSSTIPGLEVSANRDEKGERLSLFLVNYDRNRKFNAQINLAGFVPQPEAELATLWHKDVMKYNTFENPNAVQPQVTQTNLNIKNQGGRNLFELQLPAHSISVLSVLNQK